MNTPPPWYLSAWLSARWLAGQGQAFVFKLKVGKDFFLGFPFEEANSKARKKINPSTKNWNERQRQEFLESKEATKVSNPSEEVAFDSEATKSSKPNVSLL